MVCGGFGRYGAAEVDPESLSRFASATAPASPHRLHGSPAVCRRWKMPHSGKSWGFRRVCSALKDGGNELIGNFSLRPGHPATANLPIHRSEIELGRPPSKRLPRALRPPSSRPPFCRPHAQSRHLTGPSCLFAERALKAEPALLLESPAPQTVPRTRDLPRRTGRAGLAAAGAGEGRSGRGASVTAVCGCTPRWDEPVARPGVGPLLLTPQPGSPLSFCAPKTTPAWPPASPRDALLRSLADPAPGRLP